MVSAKLFASVPPFPDSVSCAQLPTISLAKLSLHHDKEIRAMFQACQESGFFVLDLNGDAVGEGMITELDRIFGVIAETMRLASEEKERYHADLPKKFWGFKRQGFMKTETGQQDRCTFFGVLQDDLLGNVPEHDTPTPVRDARPLLKSYIQHCQQVLSTILSGLETQLDLPPGTLRNLQSPEERSGTILRMIHGAPSLSQQDLRTGLLPHTDFGTVTLLANVIGGLQVLRPGAPAKSPSSTDWQWVKPQPGTLIVNMGDAMVEWTGGVLRSNLHRVNFAPGEQRLAERYALALLVRARQDAKMERISGGLIPRLEDDLREGIDAGGVGITGLTAAEWESKKAASLNAGRDIAQSRGGRAVRTAVAAN